MATSLISSTAVTTINRAPAKASMVAPFNGLKSTISFPVTKKKNDITSLVSNGGRVQCAMQKQGIEEFGPYGSQFPENHRFQLAEGEVFKEVLVRHGYIVDAIGFVVARPDGSTYIVEFGGNKGSPSKVVLRDGEYITRFSGTYGNYNYQNNEVIIGTIKIHTNLNPDGFGPFGLGEGETNVQEYTSPKLTDGPVVGVFGRHNNYLESIGVFIRTEFPK